MMTPNDVAQHRFTTARFGGYTPSDVDEFLDQLTADYTALYKENAVLKGKMKVLVEKIAEYRATEDDMRMTLLTARKAADGIIAEAKETRQKMLDDVDSEVAERRKELHRDIENAEAQLTAARKSTLDFAAAMRALVAQQQGYLDREVEFLNRLNEIEADEPQNEAPAEPEQKAEEEVLPEDQELVALMEKAAAEAEASPEAAYQSFDERALDAVLDSPAVDEPTRVMDISAADPNQDYNL